MNLLASIPLIAWGLAVVAARRSWFASSDPADALRAAIWGSLFWGVYLVLLTELVGSWGGLAPSSLVFGWLSAVALLAAFTWLRTAPASRIRLPALDGLETSLLIAIAAIVATTATVALFSAPNTWDAMTYHLPRVMHWVQNGSLAHFATHEPRQLYMSPWSEMVAAHFMMLSGGDRFANLVQWFAMALSLPLAGLVAGQLGASRRGQIFASLVAATIPMGALQAVSTQTDYVASFFVLATAYFVIVPDGGRPTRSVGVAMAAALAVLSKATAYVFVAPFLAFFVYQRATVFRRGGAAGQWWRPVGTALLLVGAMTVLVNAGHYRRNFERSGSPLQLGDLGPYHDYANERMGVGLVANTVRGAALHLTIPAPRLVARSYVALASGLEALGIDPADPDTTWPGMRFEPAPVLVHEDYSGNFVHAALIAGVLVVLCGSLGIRRRLPSVAPYVALTVIAYLLFAALLKWTPWQSRLQLPLFLLMAPALAAVLERLARPWLVALAACLFLQALPFVLFNPLHPVTTERSVFRLPRQEQYFYARPRLGEFYRSASGLIAGGRCTDVGLSLPPDAWEYPFWVLMQDVSTGPLRIESLDVAVALRDLRDESWAPCAVVCIRCDPARRGPYQSRFGAAVLETVDDLPSSDRNAVFLRSPGG